MKNSKLVLIMALSFGPLLMLESCISAEKLPATASGVEEFYLPVVREEMFGAWVNAENTSASQAQKYVIYPWGLLESFRAMDGKVPDGRGTATIVKKWTDEKGNVWYKAYQRWELVGGYGMAEYALYRISGDGKTLELIYAGSGWPNPEDMSPEKNTTYLRYQRSE